MADNKQKWQEIANRGLQDRFDPLTRVKFDEAVKRGLITIPTEQIKEVRNVDITSTPDSGVLSDSGTVAAANINNLEPDNIDKPLVKQPQESTITEDLIGGAEVAGTVLSSAIADPIAGLSGIVSSIFGGTKSGAETVELVKKALTFQPRTKEGKAQLKSVGEFIAPVGEKLGKAESFLGNSVLEVTGSPELAAIAHSLPTAALELLGVKGLKSSRLANEKLSTNVAEAIQQAAPDIKKIQTAKSEAYAALDNFGVKVKAEAFDSFANKINARLIKEGVDPTLTPKSTAALKRIVEAKGSTKTLGELDTLRKIAKGAANDIDKTDARLGNIIITELDNSIDKLSSQIGGKFKEARGLAQRAFKSQDIADMMESASHTASGLENGLRIEARKILKNKKRRKGFTADELTALRKIEQGTTLGNLTKFLGKFGISEGQATSMVGASFGAGGGGVIGSMFGGPAGAALGAVAVPAIGQMAKKTAQRITLNNTKFADDLIRAGKNSKEVTKAYLKNTPISERSVSDLTDLLMDPNLTGADVTSLAKAASSPTNKFLSDTMFFVNESKRRSKQTASVAAITQPELNKENK